MATAIPYVSRFHVLKRTTISESGAPASSRHQASKMLALQFQRRMNYAGSKTNSQAHRSADFTSITRPDQCPAGSKDGTPDNIPPLTSV